MKAQTFFFTSEGGRSHTAKQGNELTPGSGHRGETEDPQLPLELWLWN